MKVWDSCDETKKGIFALHHMAWQLIPKEL